ncbi:nucleotidyltransferase domain-containing protein [Heliobacillus mobilis]|uniref:Nucleotidyltransferase domain-containing protein n=2 Tax=Heliobacterium TaxID=2697 RepID=A0A6I3SHN3_HELMO|nr:nucleotidyltransferase domain-containing protein [Heliobacterium mobile]MTV48393.1 nucleotidyltransferase domain-containing protein [Heliobacterium mobile]
MFGLNESVTLALTDIFSQYPEVEQVIIFGSRARGDYKKQSDIDFAIYHRGDLSPSLYLDLDEAAGIYKIDVIDMKTIHNEDLRSKIERDGIEFYRKKSGG